MTARRFADCPGSLTESGLPTGLEAPRARLRSAGAASWCVGPGCGPVMGRNLPSRATRRPQIATRLTRHTLEAISAGVSARRYRRSLDRLPTGSTERSTSRSSVSRRFVALTEQKLGEWLSQSLEELDLKVVMIDGIHFKDHCILVALGIDSEGYKHPLGIVEGSTENSTVAKVLLTDLIGRGLPADRALLFVIDGAKALRKAIRDVYGPLAKVHRCAVHKGRNVLDHLPKAEQASVKRALDDAYGAKSAKLAKRQLERLAGSLEQKHPGAAGSIREGLDETLTLLELGLPERLYRSLRSTNPIESLNDKIASYARRVKRWRGGKMILRWTGAAILEAQKGFHRIKGYRDMHRLVEALRKHEETMGVHIETEAA